MEEHWTAGRSPATPFPQRIIYRKEGADLRARIEGTLNGKAGSEEWRSPAPLATARRSVRVACRAPG